MGALEYCILKASLHYSITPVLQFLLRCARSLPQAAQYFFKLSNIGQKPLPRQLTLNLKRTEVNHG
jgi:hypothetical protein